MEKVFKSFNQLKVVIVGDVMIDTYYMGKVDRISPEAPVPVVALTGKESRLGGAANVAMNIRALGAQPILCSVVGNDPEAKELQRLLKKYKMTEEGILKAEGRQTTVKTRVIGNNHQLLRIDQENTAQLSEAIEKKFGDLVIKLLKNADVLIFSDYDKGVLSEELILRIIENCRDRNIPTVVDPKKRHFLAYQGTTLFKPNLKELTEGLKITDIKPTPESLSFALKKLQKQLRNQMAMVTLSEHGVYITDGKKAFHLAAHVRNIADVSGAGDSVVSVAALCLALGLPMKDIAFLSNLAGGLVCEEIGVVPINKNKLLEEALKYQS